MIISKKILQKISLTISFITVFFSASLVAFALPYTPSETLDPSCAPGDVNCYVNVLPDQTGNAGEILTTDGTTASWASSITGGLTMAGDLAVNGGDITSTSTLTLNSATTNALTIDSGTTGAINIGTGANAKTVTIGNTTGASALTLDSGTGAISIGTGAQARTINIGTGNAIQTVVFGNTTPASTFTFSSGVTTGTALTLNAKSLTTGKALDIVGPAEVDVFEVGYNSGDSWDGVRVGVGTSGKMDQLYVDGRINYSWNMIWEDFIEYSAALTTTDGKYNSMFYDVNSTDACAVRNSVAVGSTQTSSGTVSFFCQTTGGNNAWLGTNGSAITSPSLLPVMETRIQATANTDHRVVVGFMDVANDASTLGSSDTNSAANEIMFRKAAGEAYWEGVTRSASGAEVVTEFTSYSTSAMRKLRIEAKDNTRVDFYIDDVLVGQHVTGLPASTMGLGFYIGTAITSTTLRSNTIDYIRIWSDDPLPGQFTEEELLEGEEASRMALEIPVISPVIQEVTNYLKETAEKIIDGVVRIATLFVDSLTVGSRENPAGITLFDEVTGDPYCLKIRNGKSVVVSGECGVQESNEEVSNIEEVLETVEIQEVEDVEEIIDVVDEVEEAVEEVQEPEVVEEIPEDEPVETEEEVVKDEIKENPSDATIDNTAEIVSE